LQALLEFIPLVAFLAAYKLYDMYTATAVLMVAMALLLVFDYARTRHVPTMHGISAVLVFAFGTATLLLHDERFIQWKPTVFFWVVSLAFLGSFWIGERPLVRRLLSAALGEGRDALVPDAIWKRLNALWVVFYAVLGAANLFVAFNFSQNFWVNFKVFGLTIVTFIFVGAQIFWLVHKVETVSSSAAS